MQIKTKCSPDCAVMGAARVANVDAPDELIQAQFRTKVGQVWYLIVSIPDLCQLSHS